ncbi:hypothetical protein [Caproiciproducens sp. CPB-2]|nr:hypothetical protein [Caproiciproducens sp. CPB-2]MDF1495518.1 hypothetical protein [Caproiciproducens sp. CPB-2]
MEELISQVFVYILNHPAKICIAAVVFSCLLGVMKARKTWP